MFFLRKIQVAFFISVLLSVAALSIDAAGDKPGCVSCHQKKNPGIVAQWQESRHASEGVSCEACHAAEAHDSDAFQHHGYTIAVIVSPRDCAQCHERETVEFMASHHASAAKFIGSLDNFLGVAVEGAPAAVLGCQQCHGSIVRVLENGRIDPTTWPNTGMGRINPDGSNGACTACHTRHAFSKAQARQPENCGKCHMGPDHPHIEIYNESKHGILFRANYDKMNLKSDSWVAGKDYSAAPTCATCHQSATRTQPVTHDVGKRISWTLRPVISTKLENWEVRRAEMKKVCNTCHTTAYVDSFYKQYDNAVELYNTKFARPAQLMMDELKTEGLITKTPFDDEIEWTFFELWHHEGRRARHGASMMGPDYTQWHGFYEVAKHFYTKFIPEAESLKKGVSAKHLQNDYHQWLKGLSREEMQKQLEFYKKRYGEERQ